MKTTLLHPRHRPLWSAALALVVLPLAMPLLGQTVNTATAIVILTIGAMGLNILIGYTGLVSFGHAVWFGIGAYAAALLQRHWLPDQVVLPLLLALAFVAAVAAAVGFIILRRKGVYFSLMTLALAALTYTIAFRWTAVTGGEDGLGGLKRGSIGPVNLDDGYVYYIAVALIGFAVLYGLLRLVRSPFGHVLIAIRENPLRATFQGYPIDHYKLVAFVLSAVVTALAGILTSFQHYIVSAQSVSVVLSGELLAMVVIGGMHHFLGPALGVLYYVLFREMFSIWTSDWLFWFGLSFVAFVLYSPTGLMGIGAQLRRHWRSPETEAAAMSRRKIHDGLPLPDFLHQVPRKGAVLEATGIAKHFGGIRAVGGVDITVAAAQIHALIGPNGAGKTTLFNLVSGMFPPDAGNVRLHGRQIQGLAAHKVCENGIARSFQITNLFSKLTVHENLRLSVQARHAGRFNLWRNTDDYPVVQDETRALIRYLGLEGIENAAGGDLSYGGQRLVDFGIALACKPQVLLLDEPLAGLAAAERERVSNLIVAIGEKIPVLIVEHDIDRVFAFSHHVTVMNQGSLLMSGAPAEVRTDRRVQEVYTGTGAPAVTGRAGRQEGTDTPLLEMWEVNTFYGKSHILNNASLNVREGEIVALLGRNGAGKSTLLKTLAGLVPAASGSIHFMGHELRGMPAPDIARLGIGYVPQGRGLFAGMSVADNLALG
ncbi:MAG TPA: ATP-binding cassette domain-containing protein, partial [bacterium]